jgi:glycosyltransferase involved in cell wall biosynthesis
MEKALRMRLPTIVAPNGITIPEGMQWGGNGDGYLLWLGRYDIATKGLDILLRALHRIPPSERPRLRLHGPDWRNQKEQLRTLAEELGLGRWVTLGEPIYGEVKWDAIRMASGCVYPSRWDACPVAVSEAAAMGVPMVVTRYPLANLLGSNDAAIQVDADPASVADGIRVLLSTDAEDLGSNAAAVARTHLSWDSVAGAWLQQLAEIVGRPR